MSNLRESKRKQIMAAASQQFGLYGYSASMDSIAKLADVSKQTMYAHFKNKDCLFKQCMEEKVLQYQVNKLVFDRSKPIEAVLLEFGLTLHSLLLKSGPLQTYRNAVSQIEKHPEFAAAYLKNGPQKTLEEVSYYLQDKHDDGTLTLNIPSEDATIQLVLMFHGKAVYWRYLGEDIKQTEEQKERYIQSCVDMFLNQFRTPSDN